MLVSVIVKDKKVTRLLDTRSSRSYIRTSLAENLDLKLLKISGLNASTAAGEKHQIDHTVKDTITISNKTMCSSVTLNLLSTYEPAIILLMNFF